MGPIYFYLLLPLLGITAVFIVRRFQQRYSSPFLRSYQFFILFYYTYGCLYFIGLYIIIQIFQRSEGLIPYITQIIIILSIPVRVIYIYFLFIWIFQLLGKIPTSWLKVSFWIIQAVLILYNLIALEALPEAANPANFNPIFKEHVMVNFFIEFSAILFLLIATFRMKSSKRSYLGRGMALVYLLGCIFFFLLTDIFPPPLFSNHIHSLVYVSLLFFVINGPAITLLGMFLKKNPLELLPPLPERDEFQKFVEKYQITPREEEIIRLIMKGNSNSEIGKKLYISIKTVKNNIGAIFQKTSVKNRGQLAYLAQTMTTKENNNKTRLPV